MKFLKAANYTRVDEGRYIDLLVIHDMEAPEKGTTAEAVAMFFHNQRKGNDGSSAHYCIDNNSIVQCVYDQDVAWAAPGANHQGLHFEHAGFARQNRHEWADPYSTLMLQRSARLVAQKVVRYGVPVTFLDAAKVKAGRRGITGHLQITRSGIGSGSHSDPGPSFPWTDYLKLVRAEAALLRRGL